LLALVTCFLPSAVRASSLEDDQQPVDYAIVVTGGELLAGAFADGHTHFLTGTLRPLGLRCVGSICVDDKPADIEEALRFATSKASLVIVTGGLGPTDNDITRQTLSAFTGIAVKEQPEVLAQMARRFGVPVDRLRANLRQQTQVPTRGTYLKNTQGTAVGLVFEPEESVVVALPGPPRELQAMVRGELVPYLSRRFGTRMPGCSLRVRFVGLGQSQIDQTLEEHVSLPDDVTVASQFEGSRVDFTFILPDDTPEGRRRLDELKRQVLEHLGDNVYATDDTTLEEHVVQLLAERKATLALAEAGSGGSLTAALATAEGAAEVLAGAYVAMTEEKLRQLLGIADDRWAAAAKGAAKIEQLASAVADATESQWTVAVGEPRRDDAKALYLNVVFRRPDGGLEHQRVRLYGSGELARTRLNTRLLDQLRRKLR